MPRKVLIVCDELANGGAERQLALLVQNLPPAWERRIWSLNGGPFAEKLSQAAIQVDICSRRWQWDISPVGSLLRLVKRWHPDIIHSWGWMATLAAYPIAKMFRIPLVNGMIRTGRPYYYRGNINRMISHLGDAVVSNSQAGLDNWGIHPSKGVVIYNGFDTRRIQNAFQPGQPRYDGKVVVVMAARMTREKNFSLLIAALRRLLEAGNENWKFLAIGHGEEKERLIKENTDLIEKGFLEFPEAGLEIIPFLRISDVGILLTNSQYVAEGCSNTIMEYMACGLPVIASDSGGNRELVEDQQTGFIIPDDNVDEIIAKLLWLSEHPVEANRFGENGRERLMNNFSIEKMVHSTITLYESLMSKK